MAAPTRNWRNRIVEHGEIDPRLLTPNPQNFRRHPARQNSALSAALSKLGWIDEIIVSARSGLIIDGHDRRDLAIEHGELSVPYLKVDLTPDEEKIALATFDRITDMADVDGDALATLLSELDVDEMFKEYFWNEDDLAELLNQTPDFKPIPPEELKRLDEKEPIECPHCHEKFIYDGRTKTVDPVTD